MNCGIAGDAMRFLQVCTANGVIVTQGQFTKGVTYLNALKSTASSFILEYQKQNAHSSDDPMVSSLLRTRWPNRSCAEGGIVLLARAVVGLEQPGHGQEQGAELGAGQGGVQTKHGVRL